MKTFFIILKSLVLDYYYSNICINIIIINIDQVCNSNKNYFKRSKYKQNVFLK